MKNFFSVTLKNTGRIAAFPLLFCAVSASAAPSGFRACHDRGNKVQFTYGTYANAGDYSLTLNGSVYSVESEDDSKGVVFAPAPSEGAREQNALSVGRAKWTFAGDDRETAKKITLSATVNWVAGGQSFSFKNLKLTCKTKSFRLGKEEN